MKKTYKRALQKSPPKKNTLRRALLTAYLRPSTHPHVNRDLFVSKETYKREQQKRPTKETFKRDLLAAI